MRTATQSDSLVCVMGHAAGENIYSTGQLVRADDPGVARNPQLFMPRSTPRSEWPDEYQRAREIAVERENAEKADLERRFIDAARANTRKLALPAVVKCREGYAGHVDGRPTWIERGSTSLANAPHVLASPEKWQ